VPEKNIVLENLLKPATAEGLKNFIAVVLLLIIMNFLPAFWEFPEMLGKGNGNPAGPEKSGLLKKIKDDLHVI
jgi:hypothetical protein